MEVTKIPFIEKVGIIHNSEGILELPFNESVQNHLQTIHASAQFALAETASGEALQTLFPDLAGNVVPVLRDSNIKFRKPAQKSISAHPTVAEDSLYKFKEQFEKKGRSSIKVDVEVKDYDGVVTSYGEFNWFIQSITE